MELHRNKKLPKNKKLELAAKKVVKDLRKHFKEDKWALDYGLILEDIFYTAYGAHLEEYMMNAMREQDGFNLLIKDDKLLIVKQDTSEK